MKYSFDFLLLLTMKWKTAFLVPCILLSFPLLSLLSSIWFYLFHSFFHSSPMISLIHVCLIIFIHQFSFSLMYPMPNFATQVSTVFSDSVSLQPPSLFTYFPPILYSSQQRQVGRSKTTGPIQLQPTLFSCLTLYFQLKIVLNYPPLPTYYNNTKTKIIKS